MGAVVVSGGSGKDARALGLTSPSHFGGPEQRPRSGDHPLGVRASGRAQDEKAMCQMGLKS